MTSERNVRKNAQNDKIIINTIYMKPCFPIIKKLSENCNVNAPLQFLLADYIDILMISERKLDGIFRSSQFQIYCFRAPYRLDRNDRGGGILLFVREFDNKAFIKTLIPP